MKNTLIAIAFLFPSFFISSYTLAQNGEQVYKRYCAGCHGNQLEGSSASALIKDDWKHGGDRNSILNTIKNGIPGTEMMKWEGTLSEADIEAVRDFIIMKQFNSTELTVPEIPSVIETKEYNLNIEKLVTEGLNHPWGI